MPEENEPPQQPPEQPTLLGNLAPDEMFARGMQSVKMTSGTAGAWHPPSIEECARLFLGYEVLGLLGRGGMGAVYQARQIELDRLVAIKLLPLEISVDKDFADRFRREARAMAKLNHPNIIAVYDFGTTREGHLYFVMEFVEGANLYDIIHQVGLDGDQSLSIVEQVCTALAYAHGKGIVHRDIKPANVMIDTESHVKVADFGLARLIDASTADLGHTMTGTVMGTPDYMAPEQTKGMNVDHRADIYSVGVMLYEMVCREVPKGIFDPPSHRTECDARIDQIVIRAMQQAPDRRYQSTQDMKSDILTARIPVVVPEPAVNLAPTTGVGGQGPRPPKPGTPGSPKKPATPKAPEKPALPKPAVMKAIPLPGPKKSKLPLYAGIGVGVVAIAAAALFLLKPKEKALTKAEIYAREHVAALEPGAIKLWDAPEKIPKEPGLAWEADALRLEGHSVNAFAPVSRNAVIRASIRMNSDARIPQVCVRYGGKKGSEHGYVLGLTPENGVNGTIQLQAITDGKYRMLEEWPLARAFGAGEWGLVELRALGDEVTASFNGQPLGTVHDSSQPEPGGVHVFAKANGYFRDIVYVPLDGAGGNAGTNTLHLSPSSEPWVDAINNGNLLKVGVKEGAALRMTEACKRLYIDLTPEIKDGAVRMLFTVDAGSIGECSVNVRQDSPSFYHLHIEPSLEHVGLGVIENGTGRTLKSFRLPTAAQRAPSQSNELELRVAGTTLIARTNGIEVIRLEDKTLARGHLGVRLAPGALLHAVQTLDLSKPSIASSSVAPGAATKDKPFVNTLGQEFVPVPGTQALFCRWETRVKDYAAYARVNKIDDAWTKQQKDGVPVSREPEYPVVGVSWEDARAFCQWLNEKEGAEGKLPQGMKYRLPTDEEWSRAVGLAKEEGATPKERSGSNRVYPWGIAYPPPKGKLGNYADGSYHEKFPQDKWIEGYTDGYATTSPVGSFPANAYGLYDMGGNVLQWCEDWFDASQKGRVLRGGSWDSYASGYLLSSSRVTTHPATRNYNGGFRCVLAPAAARLSPSTEPWRDVLRDPAKLVLSGGVERTPEGLRFTDLGVAMRPPGQNPQRNGAVRMLGTAGGSRPQLRVRRSDGGIYQLFSAPDGKVMRLDFFDSAAQRWTILREYPLREPLRPAQDYELELRVVGPDLTAKLNGEVIGTVTVTTSPQWEFGVGTSDHNAAPTLVKALEVLDLAAPGGASGTPAALPATGWQPVITDLAAAKAQKGFTMLPDGWIRLDKTFLRGPGQRDVALRARLRFDGHEKWSLTVRERTPPGEFYVVAVSADGASLTLLRQTSGTESRKALATAPLPRKLAPGQEYDLALAALGDELTVYFDGQPLIHERDAAVKGSVTKVGDVVGAEIKDPQWLPLPTPATATKDAPFVNTTPIMASAASSLPQPPGLSPSTEPWQDVLHDPAKLVLSGGVERTPEGLRFTDFGSAQPKSSPQHDGAMRMRTTFGSLRPVLRVRETSAAGFYQLDATDEKGLTLLRWDVVAKRQTTLRYLPLREPLKAGQDYEFELRVVGQTLTAKLNGAILGTATDGTFSQGRFGVGIGDHNDAPVLIKSLEVLDLDAPGGAKAPLAAATKDAPFVNTLGMEFVPVPIIGGPTGGQRVLFSVWDTRVQDYEVFAKETKREWPKVDFEQGPTHPAVMVSWEDAQLFCQWLTGREQAAGRLPAGFSYRLPSDHEWSCAVELGAREDAAKLPTEKSRKIDDMFPWGTQWPPPKGAGNYAGEELRPVLAAGKYTYLKDVLAGYDDGFVNTSPVGSFAANRFGLYDMGGNVWQWCEDWYDQDQKHRVLRGASWNNYDRGFLQSSNRFHFVPGYRYGTYGFRCVVGASAR